MNRFLITLALAGPGLAAPAFAETAPGYDDTLLPACLDQSKVKGTDADICIGGASTKCMDLPGGDSTAGMVSCLSTEAAQWDGLMNGWYGKALKQAEAADADLKSLGSAAEPAAPLLKTSQRNWITFRDASCAFQGARFQGGTGGGPAAAACLMELTGTQALRLRDLLEDDQ